jgi:hypothetical protein
MVSHFVRYDVRLGKIARRLEFLLQAVIETQVDLDLPIQWAVKRPHAGIARAAARRVLRAENHQLRRDILLTYPPELTCPDILCVGEHDGDKLKPLFFRRSCLVFNFLDLAAT